MGLEYGDELHYGIDSNPHGIQIEYMRVFFGVDLIETLLEHFGFLEIRFLSGVLAARKEYV